MKVTAATRPFALLGDPVSHSLSPLMQNAAMRAAAVDGIYFAVRCDSDTVGPLIRAIARAGGGGNVTIPHKATAALVIERPSAAVTATGVCNTYWSDDGRICGDNTDVEGFLAVVRPLLGTIEGARACVLGAGGAARAVVHGLLRHGAEALVVGRSAERLAMFEAQFRNDPRLRTAMGVNPLKAGSIDLVVNATPIGMADDDSAPVDLDTMRDLGAVIDLVYRAGGTALTRAASVRGIPAADGHAMLVEQGAAAFERWWKRAAPVGVMRSVVATALE
jgi:shikimate dehydrogenase